MENGDVGMSSTPVQDNIDYKQLVKKKKFSRFVMRVFDIVSASIGLILFSPLLVIVAIAIVTTSRGSVFYKQRRVGKNGKLFSIVKFRTMCTNADKQGALITTRNDCRITKVGKFLRRTKIDELPQLFNVVSGRMSLVGPRPQTEYYYNLYSDYEKQQFAVRPGVTGMASLYFSHEEDMLENSGAVTEEEKTAYYMEHIVPEKTRLNLQYIVKMNIFYNIKLIVQTFVAIFKK